MHHAGNGMLTSAYIGDVSAVCYVKATVSYHNSAFQCPRVVGSSYVVFALILALGKTKNSAEERIIDSLLEL